MLETPSLTDGPFSLVSYMPRFGQQAYFVSFPSCFFGPPGSREAVMSFSANFQCKTGNCEPNIIGANYGANLLPIRFGLGLKMGVTVDDEQLPERLNSDDETALPEPSRRLFADIPRRFKTSPLKIDDGNRAAVGEPQPHQHAGRGTAGRAAAPAASWQWRELYKCGPRRTHRG